MPEPKYAPQAEISRAKAAGAAPQFGFAAADRAFAAIFLAVGWLFWELQVFAPLLDSALPAGMGTALFTLLYAAAVLGYLFCAGMWPPRESWFWLAVLLCLGWSYALPYGGSLLGFAHYPVLMMTAEYWTLCACGRLLKAGKTSNWLAFDLLNALFVLPWGNFLRLPAALFSGLRALRARRAAAQPGEARAKRRRVWAVLGGVCAAGLCLCIVLPLLMAADDAFAGLFEQLAASLGRLLQVWDVRLWDELLARVLLAVPTGLYLYGLAYGCVRGRRACVYEKSEVCAVQRGMRVAPRATVATALACLCAVYLLFLSLQARYWFGAFLGVLPEGFSYAEYARQGFFELCRVAAVNIGILLLANIASRVPAGRDRILRLFNGALSLLTLLLLATAAGKMALYISAYGLTVRRVLASVFLLWLALVFACILLRQFRFVPLVRAAVLSGAVLFSLLCALPVEDAIYGYNAARVRAGTLAPDAIGFERGSAPEPTDAAVRFTWEVRAEPDCACLTAGDKTYVPYCPIDASQAGAAIGFCEAPADETGESFRICLYALPGYSPDEWLVEAAEGSAHREAMLLRELHAVGPAPAGLTSEYAWNAF